MGHNPADRVLIVSDDVTRLTPVDRIIPALLGRLNAAEAVWAQIGASALILREEILPGVMRGEFVGGRFGCLPVVTKAGAFGEDDTLNQLVNAMK
jgi:hypothetical protein